MEHETPAQGQGQSWTASQLADALGVTKRAIKLRLNAVTPSGLIRAAGGIAKTWTFSALPVAMQGELEARAVKRGCRNAEALLHQGDKRWEPPVEWEALSEGDRQEAQKWQVALETALKVQNRCAPGEWTEIGLRDYRAAFGVEIEARKWREFVDLVIERDQGREEWNRPELYVPARLEAAKPERPDGGRLDDEHDDLIPAVGNFLNASTIKGGDREARSERRREHVMRERALYHQAFLHFDRLVGEHPDAESEAAIRISLVRWLYRNAPGLSANEDALRQAWTKKRARWIEKGRTREALNDGRQKRASKYAGFSAKGLEIVKSLAMQNGAFNNEPNISGAFREAVILGALPPDDVALVNLNLRVNKSDVPDPLREAISPEVRALKYYQQGYRTGRLHGPRIKKRHEAKPGDVFTADDVTWNVVFYDTDKAGKVVWCGRGECLVMIDYATQYPLAYELIPGRYSGAWVRRLIWRAVRKYGLPRLAFYFENGCWASKIVCGDGEYPWQVTCDAFADLGIEIGDDPTRGPIIKHALPGSPTSKSQVEGFLKQMQAGMAHEPGHVGNCERDTVPERLKKIIARVRAGEDPRQFGLLSRKEWGERIAAHMNAFMDMPQNGERLANRPPAEVWTEHIRRHPLTTLPIELEFRLRSHRREMIIGGNGLVVNGEPFTTPKDSGYKVGQKVLVWHDLDAPEVIHLTTLDCMNPIRLETHQASDWARTPEEKAELSRGCKAIGDFRKSASERVKELQQVAVATRQNLAQPKVAMSYTIVEGRNYRPEEMATGRIIGRNLAEHQARTAERAGELEIARAYARRKCLPEPRNEAEARDTLEIMDAENE